ncbi:MAG TPA: hypothetical protein PKA63_08875 [Oligoflexia bacterium]|nr:hypothetical protein [Oligoflexia bacterium]HMP48764.1 hypothetical protein [Oligoflexia bacterium]
MTKSQQRFTDNDVFCDDESFAKIMSFVDPKTKEEALEESLKLDIYAQELLETKDFNEEHRLAILILLQARNIMARLAGIQQIGLPSGFYQEYDKEETIIDPLANKHVAIFASGNVAKTLVHVLENVPLVKDARIKAYSSIRDLINAIESNLVAGVLALHHQKGSIIDSIRHDYKNLPGKCQQDAIDFTFPPCIDVSNLTPLLVMAEKIRQLSKGERPENKKFELKESLSELLVHALIPENPVRVFIVDDTRKYIDNMAIVLQAWRNITVEVILHEEGIPEVPMQANIALLDEDLSQGIKGSKIHEYWKDKGYSGLVASTTGGEKPSHVEHHFHQKSSLAENYDSALDFVRFMNLLIKKLE